MVCVCNLHTVFPPCVYVPHFLPHALVFSGVSFLQFNSKDGLTYHVECYRKQFHPKCSVCDEYVGAISWVHVWEIFVWVCM